MWCEDQFQSSSSLRSSLLSHRCSHLKSQHLKFKARIVEIYTWNGKDIDQANEAMITLFVRSSVDWRRQQAANVLHKSN